MTRFGVARLQLPFMHCLEKLLEAISQQSPQKGSKAYDESSQWTELCSIACFQASGTGTYDEIGVAYTLVFSQA